MGSRTGWRATCRASASRRNSRCAMASIEDTLITEILAPAHAPAALELSAEAGWNQTADDWKVFLAHGRVTGVFAAGPPARAAAAARARARARRLAPVLVVPPA